MQMIVRMGVDTASSFALSHIIAGEPHLLLLMSDRSHRWCQHPPVVPSGVSGAPPPIRSCGVRSGFLPGAVRELTHRLIHDQQLWWQRHARRGGKKQLMIICFKLDAGDSPSTDCRWQGPPPPPGPGAGCCEMSGLSNVTLYTLHKSCF